jgi:hypothetical protein
MHKDNKLLNYQIAAKKQEISIPTDCIKVTITHPSRLLSY